MALYRFAWGLLPMIIILLIFSGRFWLGQIVIQFIDYITLAYWILLFLGIKFTTRKQLMYRVGICILLLCYVLVYYFSSGSVSMISPTPHAQNLWTWNMSVNNNKLDEITELVENSKASIYCMQETDSTKAALLGSLFQSSYTYTRSDPYGNSMFSRDTILAKDVYNINSQGHVMLRYICIQNGAPYSVYSVHVPPPISSTLFSLHKESLIRIAQILGQDTLPKIVCGDFNTSIYSTLFDNFLYRTDLKRLRPKNPLTKTWRMGYVPLLVLDHVLISEGVTAHDIKFLGYNGSDHRAINFHFSVGN